MSNFPLYDILYKEIGEDVTDLNTVQKKTFLTKIEKIDQNGKELIYALVKSYYLNHEENDSFILPYSGKYTNKTDIIFDLNLFPNKLKRMLYKFIQAHLNKMKEECEVK